MKSVYYLFLLSIISISCTTKVSPPSIVEAAPVTNRPTASIFYKSHEPTKANAPFSDVVQAGNLYFLSGQIGMDQTTRTLVNGGIEAETKQALENIKAVLMYHKLTLSNVVKATVILDDIEDFAVFNEIYKEYLPQKPARTTFAAEALAAGAKIEIEVLAIKN